MLCIQALARCTNWAAARCAGGARQPHSARHRPSGPVPSRQHHRGPQATVRQPQGLVQHGAQQAQHAASPAWDPACGGRTWLPDRLPTSCNTHNVWFQVPTGVLFINTQRKGFPAATSYMAHGFMGCAQHTHGVRAATSLLPFVPAGARAHGDESALHPAALHGPHTDGLDSAVAAQPHQAHPAVCSPLRQRAPVEARS